MCVRPLRRLAVLLLLITTACTLLNPPDKRRKAALDDFTYALRWQRYPEAAQFFTRDHRRTFLTQIDGLKDLNITDVRLKRVDPSAEGRTAEVLLEIDYYLLPSATLKTLQVQQTWVYFDAAEAEEKGYLITTPFPKIP